jgi:hypothetical protein
MLGKFQPALLLIDVDMVVKAEDFWPTITTQFPNTQVLLITPLEQRGYSRNNVIKGGG